MIAQFGIEPGQHVFRGRGLGAEQDGIFLFGEGKELCSMGLRNAQQMRKGGKMLAVASRHVFLQPVNIYRGKSLDFV